MGTVIISAKFSNATDEGMAKRGFMPPNEVRALIDDDVIVDSGCTGMAMAIDKIESLGLDAIKVVRTRTANGEVERRLFEGLKLHIGDRVGIFLVSELPVGTPTLLGCVPCEELGLQPDLINHRLVFLPETGPNSHYWTY